MTVVGIVHKSGTFNGQAYDNYVLHCVRPADENSNENGQITEIVKVKANLFLGSDVKIGSDISPVYDRYGRLLGI